MATVWKVPSQRLTTKERYILEYLTQHADECGIERTVEAIALHTDTATGNPLHAKQRTSGVLRNLCGFGLVEQVRRYGVLFWNRIKADGNDYEDDTFVDTTGERGTDSKLKGAEFCQILQALWARAPEPLSAEYIAKEVVMSPLPSVETLLRFHIKPGGWADNKGNLWWATVKTMERLDSIKKRDTGLKWKLLQYLHDNAKKPELCTRKKMADHFFGVDINRSGYDITRLVNKPLNELRSEGYIFQKVDDTGHYMRFQATGARPAGRKKINPYGKE